MPAPGRQTVPRTIFAIKMFETEYDCVVNYIATTVSIFDQSDTFVSPKRLLRPVVPQLTDEDTSSEFIEGDMVRTEVRVPLMHGTLKCRRKILNPGLENALSILKTDVM